MSRGRGKEENPRGGAKKQSKSADSQAKGFLMRLWLVGTQKMILAASSPICGRKNIHIQWFLCEANIYQEDFRFLSYNYCTEFQWIEFNFAPLCPAGFANFHGVGRGRARIPSRKGKQIYCKWIYHIVTN